MELLQQLLLSCGAGAGGSHLQGRLASSLINTRGKSCCDICTNSSKSSAAALLRASTPAKGGSPAGNHLQGGRADVCDSPLPGWTGLGAPRCTDGVPAHDGGCTEMGFFVLSQSPGQAAARGLRARPKHEFTARHRPARSAMGSPGSAGLPAAPPAPPAGGLSRPASAAGSAPARPSRQCRR